MPKQGQIVRLYPPDIENHGTKQDVIYHYGIFQSVVQESPAVAIVRLADGGFQSIHPSDCHPITQ